MTEHTQEKVVVMEGQEYCFHDGNRFALVQHTEENGETISQTIAEIWPADQMADKDDAYHFAILWNACIDYNLTTKQAVEAMLIYRRNLDSYKRGK